MRLRRICDWLDLRPNLIFLIALAVLFATLGADSATGVASPNLAPALTVSPETAVPNQTVVLFGAGFTPASAPGGSGAYGAHQITGLGASVIMVDGTLLTSPAVNYPINFGSAGNWAAAITIPGTPDIVAGGPVTVTVVDDQGVTLSTQLSIKTPSISVDPASSSRNSDLRVTGGGFPASTSANVQVSIAYGAEQLAVVSTDPNGEFDVTVRVPVTAVMPSSNQVRATIVGFIYQFATAAHSVPEAGITLSPTSGISGSVVTISGENFPAHSVVSDAKVRGISVLEAPVQFTDKDGKFVSSIMVPLFAPGVQTISATAGGITAEAGYVFTVAQDPVATPPTPTPQPPMPVAQALEELTSLDNLIRVWAFDNSNKQWAFFDPRPSFADASTIQNMVNGQIYWLRVDSVQTPVLNGNPVTLYKGWNLVPW